MIEVAGIADIRNDRTTERGGIAVRIVGVLRRDAAAGRDQLAHTSLLVLNIVVGSSAGDDALREVLRADRRAALGVVMRQAAHCSTPKVGMVGGDGSASTT